MPASGYLGSIQKLHAVFTLRRREEVLARNIAALLPLDTQSVLDIGCGDGVIASLVAEARPGLNVEGVEVLDRESCRIPYRLFDGRRLPFPDASFDAVSFVDVLHHTDNIEALLAEAARVSRRYLIIKDHVWSTRLDFAVLRFMDWVGNRSYGVRLVYNYQRRRRWLELFEHSGLNVTAWNSALGLYPIPFSFVFEHGKHFLALLTKR